MVQDSPNKEYIDAFEERIQERFSHEEMQNWPLERLHQERLLLENEFKMFKVSFPHQKSAMQGAVRAYVYDDENAEKHALTDAERMRLRDIKRTALGEMNQAEGIRKDKLREHRLKLYNTAIDFIRELGNTIRSVLPSW